MKRPLSLLALTGMLTLGAFAGYQANERISAQDTQTARTADSVTRAVPQGQMVPTLAPGTPAPPQATYDNGRARTEAEANTVQVVKARQDGLVYISVTEGAGNSPESQLRQRMQEQFPFNFGTPDGRGGQPRTGTGSGFFVTSGGDIVTNNHVVEGASDITIRLNGSRTEYKARVVARAPEFDLALIRAVNVPAGQIKPIPLGDSDQLDVGLKAIAMGAPFGLEFSVSEGIISSLERTVPVGTRGVEQSVIQTDAAINPGNSGGPLLNSSGQVIGVNTQILTGGIGQSAGVGFAIPVNTVKRLLPQLQAGKGGVIQTPSLGVQFTDLNILTEDQRAQYRLPASGALLQRVYPNSPAAVAGLRAGTNEAIAPSAAARQAGGDSISTDGDIITAIDGRAITEGDDLRRAVIGKSIGDSLKLTVKRGDQTREVTVNLRPFTFPSAQQ